MRSVFTRSIWRKGEAGCQEPTITGEQQADACSLKRNDGGPGRALARGWEEAEMELGCGWGYSFLGGLRANNDCVPTQFSLRTERHCEEFKLNENEDYQHGENKVSKQ